jgi:hypothetical protein
VTFPRDETRGEKTYLRASEEDDFGSLQSQPLRWLAAIDEQIEQLILRQTIRKRAKPDFETSFRGILRGNLQPIWVRSGNAYRVAVQIVVNDLHFTPNRLLLKWFVCRCPIACKARVVSDSSSEALLSANASMQQEFFIMQIPGPACAGLLIASVGPRRCFLFDAASFCISAALIFSTESKESRRPDAQTVMSVFSDMKIGMGFIFSN